MYRTLSFLNKASTARGTHARGCRFTVAVSVTNTVDVAISVAVSVAFITVDVVVAVFITVSVAVAAAVATIAVATIAVATIAVATIAVATIDVATTHCRMASRSYTGGGWWVVLPMSSGRLVIQGSRRLSPNAQ